MNRPPEHLRKRLCEPRSTRAARSILRQWLNWVDEAAQLAQQEQDDAVYTDTMLERIATVIEIWYGR